MKIMVKSKIWFTIILLLLITCVYFFYTFYNIERDKKINEIFYHQKLLAKQASKSFYELFNKWNGILLYLSEDNKIEAMNEDGIKLLNQIRNIFKDDIKAITRTNKNGIITYTTPFYSNSIGRDISNQKHMIKLLSDYKPVISDVFNAVQGFQAVVIHYPIFKKGEYSGSIAFLLDFKKIANKILEDIKIGDTGYAWMISGEGIELYSKDFYREGSSIFNTAKDNPGLISLAKEMLSGKEGTKTYEDNFGNSSSNTETKIAYFIPIKVLNTYWSVAITYSEWEMVASLTQFRTRLIIIFALLFLGGVLTSYFGIKAWLILNESLARIKAENELSKSELKYRTLVENVNIGIIQTDLEGRFLHANTTAMEMMGYNNFDDLLLLSDSELYASEDEKDKIKELLAKDGFIKNHEFKAKRVDAEDFWWTMNAVQLKNEEGKPISLLASIKDITKQKNNVELLKQSIKEKELLLQEIFHRAKNNMQVIYSIMELYSLYSDNDEAKSIINEMRGRVLTMSLVHNQLYKSQHLSRLNLQNYIYDLIKQIFELNNHLSEKLSLTTTVENIPILFDTAVPLGLFINELVISLSKFIPKNKKKSLNILAKSIDNDSVYLQIDSNIQIEEIQSILNKDGFGLDIFLKLLEKQLNAKVSLVVTNGFKIHFSFNDSLYEERI